MKNGWKGSGNIKEQLDNNMRSLTRSTMGHTTDFQRVLSCGGELLDITHNNHKLSIYLGYDSIGCALYSPRLESKC